MSNKKLTVFENLARSKLGVPLVAQLSIFYKKNLLCCTSSRDLFKVTLLKNG